MALVHTLQVPPHCGFCPLNAADLLHYSWWPGMHFPSSFLHCPPNQRPLSWRFIHQGGEGEITIYDRCRRTLETRLGRPWPSHCLTRVSVIDRIYGRAGSQHSSENHQRQHITPAATPRATKMYGHLVSKQFAFLGTLNRYGKLWKRKNCKHKRSPKS